MSQSSNTVNLLIHDSHGNPQYLKIQHGQNKMVKTISQEAVRALLQSQKAQVVSTSPGTVISNNQVFRTLNLGRSKQIISVPVTAVSPVVVKEEKALSPSIILHSGSHATLVDTNSSGNSIVTTATPTSASNKKKHDIETSESSDYTEVYTANGNTVSASKRRKTEKGGKGLRHFSMKVCEKVRNKKTTTYNEVADELVAEFTNPNLVPNSVDQQYDQKNIRRRVYDALNVLMAMNIISKEKKEIRWIGLPTSSAQECMTLVGEKTEIAERIKKKTRTLNELLLKQISMRSLIQRNIEVENSRGPPAPNTAMHLPFIVVNSDTETVIDCSITNDKTEYQFVFHGKFEINDDIEILKFIGLTYGLEKGEISDSNLEQVKRMLPKSLEKYVINMAVNGGLEENVGGGEEEEEQTNTELGALASAGEFGAGAASTSFEHEEFTQVNLSSDDEDSVASTYT